MLVPPRQLRAEPHAAARQQQLLRAMLRPPQQHSLQMSQGRSLPALQLSSLRKLPPSAGRAQGSEGRLEQEHRLLLVLQNSLPGPLKHQHATQR